MIISQQNQNTLIQLGDTISACQWGIAAIVQDELDNAPDDKAKMTIYREASQLTGKGERSIRRYVAARAFYPPDVVDRYQVLSFEHLAEAMTYPGRWRELLDACLTQMERTGGSRPSVDWMRCYASPGVVTEYEASLEFPAVDLVGNDDDPLEYVTDAVTQEPTLTAAAVQTVLRRMTDHQRALTDAVNRLPVEGAVLYRYLALVEQLEACIAEIASSLAQRVPR